jgi:pantothenate kinase
MQPDPLYTMGPDSTTMGDDLTKSVALLRGRVERLLLEQSQSSPTRRVLIALAGVPGSGKSTVSAALLQDLRSRGIEGIAVLPMVGLLLCWNRCQGRADW